MVSSWLPQNIQKRIFKYVLNRLSVFSNLDLENVDVSVGTTSNFSLNDVQLDTEKITIPGVFLRDGSIQRLDLKLGMLGGIQIDGSAIDLTIALSAPRIDDLSMLLNRTTADIAQSIVLPGEDIEDGEYEEDELQNEGFGFGEFKPTVARAFDVAVSQLTIYLRDISVKLVIDHETTLQLSIGKISMKTLEPGIRHVVVSDVEVVLFSPSLETPNESEEGDIAGFEDQPIRETDDDDVEKSQLMESMLFSHEEASTMYMSALSTVLEESRNAPPKPRILWCQKADIHFKGLGDDILIDVDKVHISLHPIPVVLLSLFKKFKEIVANDYQEEAQISNSLQAEGENHSRLAGISVAEASLSVSPLLPNGLFEDPNSIALTLTACTLDMRTTTSLLTVSEISAVAGEEKILKFSKGVDPEADFTCQLATETTILLPNPAFINASLNDLGPLLSCLRDLHVASVRVSKLEAVGRGSPDDSPSRISLQTNTFDVSLSTGTCIPNITVFPVTLKDHLMHIDKVTVKLENDLILVQNLIVSFDDNGATHIVRQDSMEVQAEVAIKLIIDKVLIDGTHSSLTYLLRDFQGWSIPQRLHALPVSTSGTSTPTTPNRGVHIVVDRIPLSINITKVESKVELPQKMGVFEVDSANVILNIISSDVMQIAISTLYLSRDFSDIDPNVKHVPLVYNAFPSRVSLVCVF
jgi:hypothetical protein